MKAANVAGCADKTKFRLTTTGTVNGVSACSGLASISMTEQPQRTAAALIAMGVRVTLRNGSGAAFARWLRNGSTLSISIPGSTTGWFQATPSPITVNVGDTTLIRGQTTLLGSLEISAFVLVFQREGGTWQRFAATQIGNVYTDPPFFLGIADLNGGAIRNLTEDLVEFVVGAEGIFKSLACYLSSNDQGGITLELRKNGKAALTLTTPSTGTGWFEGDAADEIHVARGDRVCFRLQPNPGGGANNITVQAVSVDWNGQRYFFNVFTAATTIAGPASPSYITAAGGTGTTGLAVAAEADVQARLMMDCRATRLHCVIPEATGPPADDSLTLRVNGADSRLVLDIPSGADGTLEENDGSKAAIIKAADDVAIKIGTTGLIFSLAGMTLREDINVNGQIRSRMERPPVRRRLSRIFNAALPLPSPVPIIARLIRAVRRRRPPQGRRQQRRGGIHGKITATGSPSGSGANASVLARRYATFRTSFNAFDLPAEYRFYHGLGTPPQEGDAPFATSSPGMDGFSPTDVFGDGVHYFSVSYFNGVIDSGFLPVGPSGETYRVIVVIFGGESQPPPNPPHEIRLEARAGGVVRVHASYAQYDEFRADTWAIAYTSNGSTPPEDNPTVTQLMGTGVLELLEMDLGPFSHGATIKVRVQTRKNPSNYSDGSQVLTVTADALGPTAPTDSDAIPG